MHCRGAVVLTRLIRSMGESMPATLQRPNVPKQSESVRLSMEAITKARVAAAYQGKTIGEYISDVVLAVVDQHIDEGHSKLAKPKDPKPKK